MSVERVGEEQDSTSDSSPLLTPNTSREGRYRIELTEKELMEMIGRTVVNLFSLLNQAAASPPLSTKVIILPEKTQANPPTSPAAASEESQNRQSSSSMTVEGSVKDQQLTAMPEAPTLESHGGSPVTIAGDAMNESMPVEPAVEEVPRQKTETAEPSFPTSEQIQQMINSYKEQIKFYTEAAERERKLLANEEKIQFLQQLNSQQIASVLNKDASKTERLRMIAQYEREIQQAQQKVDELEQMRKKQ